MKTPLLIACALVMVAACGKTEEPKAVAPAPLVTPQYAPPNVVPTPPAPPKGADDSVAGPAPGQANDHSSPAFKAGGQTDPKK